VYLLIFAIGISLVLALTATPLVRDFTRRRGLVDQPDFVRKTHPEAVPRSGGVAIFVSYAVAFSLMILIGSRLEIPWIKNLSINWLTVAGVSIVFATGVVDDLFGLNAVQKISGQLAGALLAYSSGVQIHSIQDHSIQMWWSLPLTVVWLVLCSNAFNLIDGIDGLAAGIGFLATATMFVAALVHNNTGLVVVTLPLMGALLGFLRYNFNPASIFLGDCGSLALGFMLGCFGVLWSDKSATLLGMTAPVMALAIPLLDTSVSMARRFLRDQPIFSGDRRHMHHRLLDRGFTTRQVVLLLYAGCGLAAVFALLENALNNQFAGLVIVLFCCVAYFSIRQLGYVEFGTATRLLANGGFQRVVDAEVRLRLLEEKLELSAGLHDWWNAVCAGSREFGFQGVRLNSGGLTLEEKNDAEHSLCQVRVPLSRSDYINFCGDFDASDQSAAITAFIRVVKDSLYSKSFGPTAVVVPPLRSPQSERKPTKVHAAAG
jgi:UDP-GlcNAc:undecaprenyl-phosphate GlcNAc-1-phosphate transferase